jgi:isochorismate synthase
MKSDWKILLPAYNYELNSGNSILRVSPCAWTKGEIDFVINDQDYIQLAQLAVDEIRKSEISKIVLSRIISSIHKVVDASIVSLFQQKFPSSCVFYIPRNDQEIWFGATPELLLEGQDGKWKTRSIAGTRLVESQVPWGDKEYFEQALVTDGIIEVLYASKATNIQLGEQYTFKSGSIEHICSDIEFEYRGEIQELVSLLHPTAAVLGKPRCTSQKWLELFEPHNREWYTGTFQIEHNDRIYIYVFLRCGKANSAGIQWYVGGGLTAESIANDELQETINKANSLEEVLSLQS